MTSTATITIDRQYKPWLATPGKDTSRPALNHIQLHPNGYMVAADGFMLMMAPIAIDGDMPEPVCVPAAFIEAVYKHWMGQYPIRIMTMDDGTTRIEGDTDQGLVVVSPGEHQFPDYWRIIPTEYEDATTATIDPVKLLRLYESLVGSKREPVAVSVYQSKANGPCLIAPTMSDGIGVIMPMHLSDKGTTSRRNLDERIKLFRDGIPETDHTEDAPASSEQVEPETYDSADEYNAAVAEVVGGAGESVHDEVKRLCLEALDESKTVSTLARQINGRMVYPYPSDAQESLGTLVHDACNELVMEGKISAVIDGGKGNNAKYAPLNYNPASLKIHVERPESDEDPRADDGGYPTSYADDQDEVLSLHIKER